MVKQIHYRHNNSRMLGENASPLNRTSGSKCASDLIAVQKRAAPPIGSTVLFESMLYTSLKCRMDKTSPGAADVAPPASVAWSLVMLRLLCWCELGDCWLCSGCGLVLAECRLGGCDWLLAWICWVTRLPASRTSMEACAGIPTGRLIIHSSQTQHKKGWGNRACEVDNCVKFFQKLCDTNDEQHAANDRLVGHVNEILN